MDNFNRRNFIKTALLSGAALSLPWSAVKSAAQAAPASPAAAAAAAKAPCRVALTAGEDRADIAFQGLKQFSKEIAAAIGDKMVIIKPNNVSTTNQLAATHALNIEGILEFLKSIGKSGNVIIAESPAGRNSALVGFANFGYDKLAAKYGAKMVELDKEGHETVYCIDERTFAPKPCQVSSLLLDPKNFVISAAKFKTHDRVVATLSLKNIVVGAPVNRDKQFMHGGGYRGINYNLFQMAQKGLRPALAVIDGYEGMEGNGPVGGTAVQQRVCVVSPDWLAADRVGLELMGINYDDIGWIQYCAAAGMGEGDLKKIEILGPAIKDHVKNYVLPKSAQAQLIWKTPLGPPPAAKGGKGGAPKDAAPKAGGPKA